MEKSEVLRKRAEKPKSMVWWLVSFSTTFEEKTRTHSFSPGIVYVLTKKLTSGFSDILRLKMCHRMIPKATKLRHLFTRLQGGQEENAALQLRWVRDEMPGIGGSAARARVLPK